MSGTAVYDAKMTLENSGFIAAMGKARESSSKALETIKTIGFGVTGLGGAFAAFKGADAFAEGLKNAFEQGRALTVQARQMSTNVASVVQLRKAFTEAGIGADGVGTAVYMLNKALGGVSEEGVPTATAFQKIGLSIGQLKKMNPVQQFKAIIQGLNKLPDAATRANVAAQIFGRGAKDLQAVLADPEGFNEAIKNSAGYAKTMQRNAAAFEAVSKSVEQLQNKAKGFYAGIAAGIAPALQSLLNVLNKIDLSAVGAKIGNLFSVITEAFKEGQVGKIIELSLILAFKTAINVMYGAIFGLAAAFQVEFQHVPSLIKDAFAMLTNGTFWKGIGELMLGGMLSQESRLAQMFLRMGVYAKSLLEVAVNAMGAKLATVLKVVNPVLGSIMDLAGLNADNRSNAQVFADNQKQAQPYEKTAGAAAGLGDALVKKGASDVASASTPLVKNYLGMLKEEMTAALAAFKSNNALSTPEKDQLAAIIKGLQSKVDAAGKEAPAKKDDKSSSASATKDLSLKAPQADDRARLGFFIGSSPAAPGISEARRTAKATEETVVAVKKLVQMNSGRGQRLGDYEHPAGAYA